MTSFAVSQASNLSYLITRILQPRVCCQLGVNCNIESFLAQIWPCAVLQGCGVRPMHICVNNKLPKVQLYSHKTAVRLVSTAALKAVWHVFWPLSSAAMHWYQITAHLCEQQVSINATLQPRDCCQLGVKCNIESSLACIWP